MSEEKKTIVRDLKFGGLMHIPPLRVHHQVLRELANNFKLGENRLKTGYGDLFPQKVDYKKLSDDDKEIFRRFQGKTLKSLTDEMMDIGGITDYKEKKKKAIDGCLFALMIIYFHLSKNKGKKRAERPPKPWIANWSKEQLDERMTAEREENMGIVKMAQTREKMKKNREKRKKTRNQKNKKRKASSTSSSEQETTDSDSSTSESETQEDPEDSPRKQPSKKRKKMDSKKRKKSQEDEDSDSESESTDETQSKKKKVVVEHSSPEEDQFYDGDRYEIGSEDLDELLRENNEKSAAEGEKEADLRSTEGHYVSSETIPDVNLGSDDPSSQGHTEQSSVNRPTESIIPIQVFVPMSQTTTVPKFEETPETDFEPTPLLQIEGTTKIAAKEESKSPQIQKETGGESSGKFETPAEINQHMGDMKEKCYICGTRVKTYADGSTNEFDNVCTLIAQDKYILNRMHLASLQAGSYIESEIVSAMCLILNQKNDERFQEQVYCLPPDIMSMAVSKHPNGEFISPKTNKEFKNFAHVCYSGHWWLWVIDTTKRRFYILDPLHKKAPSDERKQLNKFIGYVISRMRAYAGGAPLKKKENELEIKPTYVNISGQKSSYDCAIYVMKWLELIEPENIKRAKYEWDNWPQDEVDHYRVEYASQILFSEMNKERDQAIRASNAIRLSKPSSVLLSPFCQINSTDIETE
ncbi:hypothetical protein Ahy_B05g076690 [Arachis hypogaea]|uniref:Ubiquitin-like protease family profile domain-containing protein n=1 Tax=Arachis hypogaea TaxID=3818 RepID=A0A444Z3V0_ARAHY|nr:hypothetical protein Ahy_B05g076690 [Arachis hypogaea]